MKISLLGFFLLSTFISGAQTDNNKTFSIGTGLIGSQTLKNEQMSSLSYKGSIIELRLEMQKTKENLIQSTRLSFFFGTLKTKHKDGDIGSLSSFNLDIEYSYSKKIATNKLQLYLGGTIGGIGNYTLNPRMGNNSSSFNITASLGPNFILQSPINILKKEFHLSYYISCPIIAYSLRPNYLNIPDYTDPEDTDIDEIFSNDKVLTIPNYVRLKSLFEISRTLRNGHKIKVYYQWDYTSFRPDFNFQLANQSIEFVYMFKI